MSPILINILAIIGGISVFALSIALFFAARFFYRLRNTFKEVKNEYGDDLDALEFDFPEPFTCITGVITPGWENPDSVEAKVAEYRSIDFEEVGVFSSSNSDKNTFVAMVCEEHAVVALIWEGFDDERIYSEVYSVFDDGASIVVTDQSQAENFIAIKNETVIRMAMKAPYDLCRELHEARKETTAKVLPARRIEFVSNYVKLSESRALARVETILADRENKMLKKDSSDSVAPINSYSYFQSYSIREWCVAEFAKSSTLNSLEWLRQNDDFLVVHKYSNAKECFNSLMNSCDSMDLPEAMRERIVRMEKDYDNRRELFATFNNTLPQHARFLKIGEVDFPIAADIYTAQRG
ncbi:MAG: hypothetical protein QM496_13025 [Verrucomicrobiota bacterium]